MILFALILIFFIVFFIFLNIDIDCDSYIFKYKTSKAIKIIKKRYKTNKIKYLKHHGYCFIFYEDKQNYNLLVLTRFYDVGINRILQWNSELRYFLSIDENMFLDKLNNLEINKLKKINKVKNEIKIFKITENKKSYNFNKNKEKISKSMNNLNEIKLELESKSKTEENYNNIIINHIDKINTQISEFLSFVQDLNNKEFDISPLSDIIEKIILSFCNYEKLIKNPLSDENNFEELLKLIETKKNIMQEILNDFYKSEIHKIINN